jgi:hypothetical protein
MMLVLINVVYVAWRYQDAALQPKELAPLLTNRCYGGSIRLLNESVRGAGSLGSRSGELACLCLGGMANERKTHLIARRLKNLDVDARRSKRTEVRADDLWLSISPESKRLVSDPVGADLHADLPGPKTEIMSCAGIATED